MTEMATCSEIVRLILGRNVIKLFFLFAFISLTAFSSVGKSQHHNEFFSMVDPNFAMRLLNQDGLSGAAFKQDFSDEAGINRVVSMLENHVKQWSFIEAQLLEPNVNLGMPEIFIPLKHLTTTLEVLGNIFYMRDELSAARNCLEKACPLMELLPTQTHDDRKITSGCFALLREIYVEIRNRKSQGVSVQLSHQTLLRRQHFTASGSRDRDASMGYYKSDFKHGRRRLGNGVDVVGIIGRKSGRGKSVDTDISVKKRSKPSGAAVGIPSRKHYPSVVDKDSNVSDTEETEEFNEATSDNDLSGPQQHSDTSNNDDDWDDIGDYSRVAVTSGSSSYPSQQSFQVPELVSNSGVSHDEFDSLEEGMGTSYYMPDVGLDESDDNTMSRPHDINDDDEFEDSVPVSPHTTEKPSVRSERTTAKNIDSAYANDESVDNSDDEYFDDTGDDDSDASSDEDHYSIFDIDSKIAELRAPYNHLRSELKSKQLQGSKHLLMSSPFLVHEEFSERLEAGQRGGEYVPFPAESSLRDDDLPNEVEGRSHDGDDSFDEDYPKMDMGLGGVRLCGKLEELIKRFIYENENGRKEILSESRDYLMDVRTLLASEGFTGSELDEQLEVGLMVTAVMSQALSKGLSFISTEIHRMGLLDPSGMLAYSLGVEAIQEGIATLSASDTRTPATQSDLAKYQNFVSPSGVLDQFDQIRLLVLVTFDQTFRNGEIGIGSGSHPSIASPSSSSSNDINSPGGGQGNPQSSSRRERRRKIDRAEIEIDFETPENVGILSQPMKLKTPSDTTAVTLPNVIALGILGLLIYIGFISRPKRVVSGSHTQPHSKQLYKASVPSVPLGVMIGGSTSSSVSVKRHFNLLEMFTQLVVALGKSAHPPADTPALPQSDSDLTGEESIEKLLSNIGSSSSSSSASGIQIKSKKETRIKPKAHTSDSKTKAVENQTSTSSNSQSSSSSSLPTSTSTNHSDPRSKSKGVWTGVRDLLSAFASLVVVFVGKVMAKRRSHPKREGDILNPVLHSVEKKQGSIAKASSSSSISRGGISSSKDDRIENDSAESQASMDMNNDNSAGVSIEVGNKNTLAAPKIPDMNTEQEWKASVQAAAADTRFSAVTSRDDVAAVTEEWQPVSYSKSQALKKEKKGDGSKEKRKDNIVVPEKTVSVKLSTSATASVKQTSQPAVQIPFSGQKASATPSKLTAISQPSSLSTSSVPPRNKSTLATVEGILAQSPSKWGPPATAGPASTHRSVLTVTGLKSPSLSAIPFPSPSSATMQIQSPGLNAKPTPSASSLPINSLQSTQKAPHVGQSPLVNFDNDSSADRRPLLNKDSRLHYSTHDINFSDLSIGDDMSMLDDLRALITPPTSSTSTTSRLEEVPLQVRPPTTAMYNQFSNPLSDGYNNSYRQLQSGGYRSYSSSIPQPGISVEQHSSYMSFDHGSEENRRRNPVVPVVAVNSRSGLPPKGPSHMVGSPSLGPQTSYSTLLDDDQGLNPFGLSPDAPSFTPVTVAAARTPVSYVKGHSHYDARSRGSSIDVDSSISVPLHGPGVNLQSIIQPSFELSALGGLRMDDERVSNQMNSTMSTGGASSLAELNAEAFADSIDVVDDYKLDSLLTSAGITDDDDFDAMASQSYPLMSSQETQSLHLSSHCSFLPASRTRVVKVVSDEFGSSSIKSEVTMKRSMGNSSLWRASIQLPPLSSVFKYKYLVVDDDSNTWIEAGPLREVALDIANGITSQEDSFHSAESFVTRDH